MKFAHLLSRITSTPWLITQDALEGINALIEARINNPAADPAPRAEEGSGTATSAADNVAVIGIRGVIGKRLSMMEAACGGVDIEAVERAFDMANADSNISRIVLHIDSPGGTVTGVPELAEKIYSKKRKPVMAFSDTKVASAAYYLASAADEIVVTPTAIVGSIGVVLQVRETLNAEAADGRTRLRVFRSGADKAAGVDGPISPEQAAAFQAQVDKLGAMFRADVTKARPSVTAESMTGMTWFGEEAVGRHLADRMVQNFAEALSSG